MSSASSTSSSAIASSLDSASTLLLNPLHAHPYACAYIANAQILDQATRSVKSRRKVKQQQQRHQHQGEGVRTREKLSSPSAAVSGSSKSPHKSSFTRTKLALQDAMLQASKLMDHVAGDDVEVLRSSRQSTTSSTGSTKLSRRPLTPGTAIVSSLHRRKRTNKALGQALRKSRDLRSTKQDVEEMLSRPLPSIPTEHRPKTVTLPDESPIVPQLFSISSKPTNRMLPRKLVPQGRPAQKEETDVVDKDGDDSTDDWAIFIASGYRDFPMPPTSSIRETMAAAQRTRQQAKECATTTKPKRRSTAIAPLKVQASNTAPRTGVDWLDDELAQASAGEESCEELRTIITPKTASSATSSVGLGLMRSARTPPSSSVDTFASQPMPPLLPAKSEARSKNATWRLSTATMEVFVTPNSSPQIDYGHMVTAPSESPAMVKHAADLPLAQVGRRPSCASSSYKVHFVNDLEDGVDDDFYKRHDSVSSAASSALSRDFSVADSASTRRTSIGGASECSSVAHSSHIVSPSRVMRSDAMAKTLASYSFNSPASGRISLASNEGGPTMSPRTNANSADSVSSVSSSPRRRRASSRVPFPDHATPATPVRLASLQHQQAPPKRSIDCSRRPPLMGGAWMEGSGAIAASVPLSHSQSSPGVTTQKTTSSATPKTSTEVLAALREQKASKSQVDLSLRTSSVCDEPSGDKGKNGLRSLFGSRPRRESSTAMPEMRNQVYTADGPLNVSSITLTDKQPKAPKKLTIANRSRSSGNLDRLLARMGAAASPIDLLLPPRPMADVPITPASADAEMPESPSHAIFGSAASFLGGAGGASNSALHAAMAAHCSKQTSEQMRAFAEASHAARRTSSVCVTDMPTQIAGDVAAMERHLATCNRRMGGSLSRASSLRARGALPAYEAASPLGKHGSGDAVSPPSVPAKDNHTAIMRATRPIGKSAAPPVAFWRRNGVHDHDDTREDVNSVDVDDGTISARPVVRRKSSFTLWR